MFDFGDANDAQKKAITCTDGPLLISAGPGTGKTFTLVQRAIYLIQEKKVKPEQILMATFTEKAAKEIITRVTDELASRDILVNINDMYIGTFHSICLRFIKENLDFAKLEKNYRMLDDFDQQYFVYQNLSKFNALPNIETLALTKGWWRRAQKICFYVNTLAEELVSAKSLLADKNPKIKALGEILEFYQNLMEQENLLDFSTIQTVAYNLLKENPALLQEIQEKISHLMIDEYQDTNYIQEQIVFLLGDKTKNICVVGDDDQV